MKKDRIKIWPLGIVYVIFVLGITGAFILGLAILPFWALIENESIKLFDIIPLRTGVVQFMVFFPIAIIGCYMYIKTILFKISFTRTNIIVPRLSKVQDKKVDIECNQILSCEPIPLEGFYYFFAFNCVDGTKRKIFITRFSFKQLARILKLIKERGGLQEQEVNEIINPLRIKKNNKKH